MANSREIQALVASLHTKGIINADKSVKEFIAAAGEHLPSSGAERAGWYVIGGEHYVVVCGSKIKDIAINPVKPQ